MNMIMSYYGISWHIVILSHEVSLAFFEVASSDDISRFRQLAVQVLRVNPQQTQWRLPMTDPWCCHIYAIYGNMDPMNIPQSC